MVHSNKEFILSLQLRDPGRRVLLISFVYIQMTESTESELSSENTEEKNQSLVDLQMTEFKLSVQITEKEKQSRVVL